MTCGESREIYLDAEITQHHPDASFNIEREPCKFSSLIRVIYAL